MHVLQMCLLFVHVFHGRKRIFYGGETDQEAKFLVALEEGRRKRKKKKRGGEKKEEKRVIEIGIRWSHILTVAEPNRCKRRQLSL